MVTWVKGYPAKVYSIDGRLFSFPAWPIKINFQCLQKESHECVQCNPFTSSIKARTLGGYFFFGFRLKPWISLDQSTGDQCMLLYSFLRCLLKDWDEFGIAKRLEWWRHVQIVLLFSWLSLAMLCRKKK